MSTTLSGTWMDVRGSDSVPTRPLDRLADFIRARFQGGEEEAEVLGTKSGEPSEIHFRANLDAYFALRGIAQKDKRAEVAQHILKSRERDSRLRQVLRTVGNAPSEERLEAGIELLRLTGAPVVRLAEDFALQGDKALPDPAAYALAAAAGRVDPNIIDGILAASGRESMREAAVELAESLGPRRGRELLKRFAHDRSSYIRARARELLVELS